jgi:hypothetical protein
VYLWRNQEAFEMAEELEHAPKARRHCQRLHDMLHFEQCLANHDGYLAEDFDLPSDDSLAKLVLKKAGRGDGLQMRDRYEDAPVLVYDNDDIDCSRAMADQWQTRILAIAEHLEQEQLLA